MTDSQDWLDGVLDTLQGISLSGAVIDDQKKANAKAAIQEKLVETLPKKRLNSYGKLSKNATDQGFNYAIDQITVILKEKIQ